MCVGKSDLGSSAGSRLKTKPPESGENLMSFNKREQLEIQWLHG